jgi:hypothetical protein
MVVAEGGSAGTTDFIGTGGPALPVLKQALSQNDEVEQEVTKETEA